MNDWKYFERLPDAAVVSDVFTCNTFEIDVRLELNATI